MHENEVPFLFSTSNIVFEDIAKDYCPIQSVQPPKEQVLNVTTSHSIRSIFLVPVRSLATPTFAACSMIIVIICATPPGQNIGRDSCPTVVESVQSLWGVCPAPPDRQLQGAVNFVHWRTTGQSRIS
eukprot:1246807-Amphidinium_carterae.1